MGEDATYVVDELKAQVQEVKKRVRAFVSALTNSTFKITTSASQVADEPSSGETSITGAVRSLAEESSGSGGCVNSAVLSISVQFDELVVEETLQQIENQWPDLVNATAVKPCGGAVFTMRKDIDSEADGGQVIPMVALIVVIPIIAFVACCFLCFVCRKKKKKEGLSMARLTWLRMRNYLNPGVTSTSREVNSVNAIKNKYETLPKQAPHSLSGRGRLPGINF